MQPWCRVTASSVGGRLPTAGISVRQVTTTPAPGVGMPMYAGAGSGVFLLLARTTKNAESPGAIRGVRVDGSRTCAAATAGRRQESPQARCRRGEPGPPELLRRGGVGDSVAGLSRPDRVPIIFEIIHKVNVRHLSIFRSWTQGTLLETDTGS